MTIWLSPEILTWDTGWDSLSSSDPEEFNPPYRMWAHADQILSAQPDEFARVDALTTLKRTVDRRLRQIDERYSIRAIPLDISRNNLLERLEYLQIIRRTMLGKLMELRNSLEHEHTQPPNIERCREFAEFAWYFLKSTDGILRFTPDDITFTFPSMVNDFHDIWICVNLSPDTNWELRLRGWVRDSMLCKEERDTWLRIDGAQLESRADWKIRTPNEDDGFLQEGEVELYDDSDLYVEGLLTAPKSYCLEVIRKYFSLI